MAEILNNKESVLTDELSFLKGFRRLVDFIVDISSASSVKDKKYINILNHLHFTGKPIYIHIKSRIPDEDYIITAYPEPCLKEVLVCRLHEPEMFNPENYYPVNIIIDDENSIIIVPVEQLSINEKVLTLKMSDTGYLYGKRENRRYHCQDVNAEILQGNLSLKGELKEFSPFSFCIKLCPESLPAWNEFDRKSRAVIRLLKGQTLLFSGECAFVRNDEDFKKNNFVFNIPSDVSFAKYSSRKYRHPRLHLIPPPKASFNHPLCSINIQHEIDTISTAGFSILVESRESLLIPGMIIPYLEIRHAGGQKFVCSAQIVYCDKSKKDILKYGFVITDMDVITYRRFFDLICNSMDPFANFTNNVDFDELWEFLFKSGFIYPEKYGHLAHGIDDIKDNYRKLYNDPQDIFVNYTYQQNGRIYGHCSMLKAYQRTWIVQHLAARPLGKRNTIGLHVLDHVLNYYDGKCRYPSAGMDYMVIYYRPVNRFSDYFFGDFCRALNDPKACSMDLFDYFTFEIPSVRPGLPDDWRIELYDEATDSKLLGFYEQHSGGLLLKTYGIGCEYNDEESIENKFRRYGLKRDISIYSLKKGNDLKAVFFVEQSSEGINLSDLLNCIKIIIIDENLPMDILSKTITILGAVYNKKNIIVLSYPSGSIEKDGLKKEKEYYSFVLESGNGYRFVENFKEIVEKRFGRYFS